MLGLVGRCQYAVTGLHSKFDLQSLFQCGTTHNCLLRSVPDIYYHVPGKLSSQERIRISYYAEQKRQSLCLEPLWVDERKTQFQRKKMSWIRLQFVSHTVLPSQNFLLINSNSSCFFFLEPPPPPPPPSSLSLTPISLLLWQENISE